jgi:hypothetical protein
VKKRKRRREWKTQRKGSRRRIGEGKVKLPGEESMKRKQEGKEKERKRNDNGTGGGSEKEEGKGRKGRRGRKREEKIMQKEMERIKK